MSFSSLPVECGLSFSHAFWDVYDVQIILCHYNLRLNCKLNDLKKLFVIFFIHDSNRI